MPFEAIVLNKTSGEGRLRARSPIDCELQKEYTFIIQAYDCGSGPSGTNWKKSHKWVTTGKDHVFTIQAELFPLIFHFPLPVRTNWKQNILSLELIHNMLFSVAFLNHLKLTFWSSMVSRNFKEFKRVWLNLSTIYSPSCTHPLHYTLLKNNGFLHQQILILFISIYIPPFSPKGPKAAYIFIPLLHFIIRETLWGSLSWEYVTGWRSPSYFP